MGALAIHNWAEMAAFAEQALAPRESLATLTVLSFRLLLVLKVHCTVLAEAALMMGLRQLLPHLLVRFPDHPRYTTCLI